MSIVFYTNICSDIAKGTILNMHSTLLEKWKITLDSHGYAGAIITDLSKAFDTINHELLLAKLHAYGFDTKALLLIKSFWRIDGRELK